jgi:hypothetical protein
MLQPSIEDLQKIATTGIVAERIRETGEPVDENNFTADYIAAVLTEYGIRQGWNL